MSLRDIQAELKAPKNQYNSFGGYNYRSAEDILEAVKPLLKKYEMTLVISDTMEQIGERYYVKATATLKGKDEEYVVSAYAREPLEKKGMDGCQLTGTASSYSRKYCLNGLFLIDDCRDADTDEYHKQTSGNSKPKQTEPTKEELIEQIKSMLDVKGMTLDEFEKVAGRKITALTIEGLHDGIKWIKGA